MKLDDRIRSRAAALIEKGGVVLATHRPNAPNVIGFPTLDTAKYAEWRNQSLAFLADLLGSQHTYTKNFQTRTEDSGYQSSTEAGIGILRAVLEDIEQGYIETVRQLLTAEVFSDFFEQAEHLLQSGYVAPAASLAGAVLENGLRSIASRAGVRVKARDDLSSLNNRLGQKGVYSRLIQKRVSYWTDIRNAADHGQFNEITKNDVGDLVRGAQSFLADNI